MGITASVVEETEGLTAKAGVVDASGCMTEALDAERVLVQGAPTLACDEGCVILGAEARAT